MHFRSQKIQTTKYSGETVSYLGPKLWTSFPEDYESLSSREEFKVRRKTQVSQKYPCAQVDL